MIDVSVLIVNYNTADLVRQCILSVLKQRGVQFEIIVVDNCSHDNSVSVLQSLTPQITLLANVNNLGFGTANNQAFNISKGRYLFMLNPDAVCLNEQDLFLAVQFMDQHPQYGLMCTRIIDSQGQI